MKAILRKTKEVVDVISYVGHTERSDYDRVTYIDQNGGEHRGEGLNYYLDFVEFDTDGFIRDTAKMVVAAMYANPNLGYWGGAEQMAEKAVEQAVRLAETLFIKNYI